MNDLVWVHDYHLIRSPTPCGGEAIPTGSGFSSTFPFPPPEVLTSLPNHEQLIPLLMQYDVVGFQTEGDAGNFVRYLMSERNQGTGNAEYSKSPANRRP